jgi:hypothetical protein
MSIRISGLAALVAAMLLATGASSQAAYTLTTSVANVTYNGIAVSTTNIAAGSTITGIGFSATATNGGVSFVDSAGSTVYILNDTHTANTFGAISQQIFVSAPGTDLGVLNFTTLINPSGAGSSFMETLSTNVTGSTGFQFLIGAGQASIIGPTTEFIAPTSITVGGQTITAIATASTSGNANSSQNPTVSAIFLATAVPEPASVAMLGLGLLSVGGVALRRRMAK